MTAHGQNGRLVVQSSRFLSQMKLYTSVLREKQQYIYRYDVVIKQSLIVNKTATEDLRCQGTLDYLLHRGQGKSDSLGESC